LLVNTATSFVVAPSCFVVVGACRPLEFVRDGVPVPSVIPIGAKGLFDLVAFVCVQSDEEGGAGVGANEPLPETNRFVGLTFRSFCALRMHIHCHFVTAIKNKMGERRCLTWRPGQ